MLFILFFCAIISDARAGRLCPRILSRILERFRTILVVDVLRHLLECFYLSRLSVSANFRRLPCSRWILDLDYGITADEPRELRFPQEQPSNRCSQAFVHRKPALSLSLSLSLVFLEHGE